MKKIFSVVVTGVLAVLLAFTDVLGGVSAIPAAVADELPSVTLNGTVSAGEPGYLNPKASVLSTGTETRLNYRLVPGWASGAASGVRVAIHLPSLEYDEATGEYRVLPRDRAPSKLGVQGRVSAGGGWNVISDTTMRGGAIVMEYDGDLGAGTNPAFDIYLTTYNDGTDGPYGGVPEGTTFELNGFVSYEMFNRVEGSSWSTPHELDDESRVSVISSDLHWETGIESYVPGGGSDLVPIWDRYQYIDYMYTLSNTSENPAANIDGYSVTFDIDSTASSVNGIIPFDINRWVHNEGGTPTANPDRDYTSGQFVGVPGEGGILIYDVTDWDGESELTDEIPYTYSGTGMITIDREHGANKQPITPGDASERKYLISLPLSRQGFPSPPTKFKVTAITNVLFAKTANWAKTRLVEREIVVPSYDFTFSHTTKQNDVVYGYETYNEITNLTSASNAPVFDPRIDYGVDPDFAVDRVTYEFDQADTDFEKAEIVYSYTDEKTGEKVTQTLQPAQREEDGAGLVTLTFDLSELNELDWDRQLSFSLTDRVDPGETLPVTIKIFGEPYRVGPMNSEATVVYIEKIASNDDFGENTTYTEVEHEAKRDVSFNVIYPKEVVPSIQVSVDGKGPRATVPWNSTSTIDFLFGVNDTVAANSTTTLVLNSGAERLKDAELILKEALFAQAENVRVKYETLAGKVEELDLSEYSGTGDLRIALPAGVAKVFIDTDELSSNGAVNFVSVAARVGDNLDKQHTVTAEIRTYQPKPYDKDTKRQATGTIDIQLPNELVPAVDVVGVYGASKTQTTTHVGYESRFGVEYKLDTRGVNSPSSEYVIDMLKATKTGSLVFSKIALQSPYLDNASDIRIVFVDAAGAKQEFTQAEVAAGDVTLGDIAKIIITGEDLSLQGLQTIAIVEYDADIEMGSSQTVRATFTGTQEPPYTVEKTATKNNQITVRETKTGVKVEGVNQVTRGLGAGSSYSMEIYRPWSCDSYTCVIHDYTLDQGYKSLGGFTSTITRPTAAYDNNNQRVSVDVNLPFEHFDLYYLKIREEMRPYIDTVEIYRMVDGKEELWKTVPGSEWVENTQEGSRFWRINTARPDMADDQLFVTHPSVAGVQDHPYYKEAWDADVRPEAPVSRVAVKLQFTRDSNDALPQMAGTQNDVVEYMGRFHSSSVTGKKPTVLTSTDRIGLKTVLTRTATHSVNSLVGYPVAETSTGANDTTSLPDKVIPMGRIGEYLASIRNVNTYQPSRSYCLGHGPNLHVPVATEADEWLCTYDPASFHDELIYEFTYPASPKDDAVYNLEAKYFTIADSTTMKYLTGVRAFDERGDSVEIRFDAPLSAAARFDYDNTQARGIHDDGDGTFTVSFGENGGYPKRFEAVFSKAAGFGERTAEIDGAAADTLGASLAEVDVRVGGIVNGNKALRGTTKLYRVPDDTGTKTLMSTTSATLTGYTPKLGAKLSMVINDGVTKVYDYAANGTDPNTTRVAVGIENSSEADIKDAVINVRPDAAFRTRAVEIPSDIFAGDWSVQSVVVSQGTKHVTLDLADFTDRGDGFHVFELQPLFDDGTLTTQDVPVSLGGTATLRKQHLDNIAVKFVAKDATVGLWGSLTRANSVDPLPTKMREGGDVFLAGVWVDEETGGPSWQSKPSFVTDRTKGGNETLMYHTSFNTNAVVTSYNTISVSAGAANNSDKPTLTLSSASGHPAPRLYTRVARMETHAVHLQQNFERAADPALFYDADTGAQIDYRNMAVGDTTKVLYELRNVGGTAPADDAPGALPVFRPVAHIEAPAGLRISDVQASSDFMRGNPNREARLSEGPNTAVEVAPGDVTIATPNTKRADVSFDVTLNDRESVFFYVEFTAVNDFGAALGATQGKTPQWNAYARPAYTHHFMSYDSTGVNGTRITGTTTTKNYDGDSFAEHLGQVQNHLYRYSDPNQLVIESRFDRENVSGETMTLTVKNIRNEILHDNTDLDLNIALDAGALGAFELTGFPAPQYPAGFTGTFGATETGVAEPKVFFKHGSDWVPVADFDPDVHKMAAINELRVSYGTVPAVDPATGATFEAQPFTIPGIGHWRSAGAATTKSYVISSQARTTLTHQDDAWQPVASYTYLASASQRVYKAIPTVEFNIQSFGSAAEAAASYSGSRVGKTDYVAGDEVFYRLTAKNHTSRQGTSTDTPYGKAPLRHPVIFDKLPEYLQAELSQHVHGGELDVQAAIDAGALQIVVRDEAGQPRAFTPPKVTVEAATGLDIAGSQTFNKAGHNNGWGLLSNAEPLNTTANPADEIDFQVFTYDFQDETLGRGEQIEIIYPSQVRTDIPLPRADYADGTPVFAPLFGWYSSNVPVANSAMNTSMDMASLLHDAGITGNRGHEMTDLEFLSNSYSWQPGSNAQRRHPNNSSGSNLQTTFYDETANKQKSHPAYLREAYAAGNDRYKNDLYLTFAAADLEDNFRFASKGRVNDGAVLSDERILWAQDGMQLSRAWLYGASEMLPAVKRGAYGTDAANFYEHDGTLNSYNRHRLGYTPYVDDPYTYAVELHERFTVRLHAANLGDREVESGLLYTEILPLGITPYDEDGKLIGITAVGGNGNSIPSTFEVIQSPDDDQGYRAPAQSQEAGTYKTATLDDGVPYVVQVKVATPLTGMFNAPGSSANDKYQRVDIGVRVYEERPPATAADATRLANISYWHDQFTLTSIEEEEYLEIYGATYGGFSAGINQNNTWRYPNDGMSQGIEVNDLAYYFGSYTSYFAVEPWGAYIRGLNAQGTTTTSSGKPAIVTGDQIAMRKPTLRVWTSSEKDEYASGIDPTIQDFSLELYEEFTLHSTVENQQLEVLGEYNRVNSGYNYYSGDNLNQDIWLYAPQTIGGARGSWFEPTVTIALPYGVAPVLEDGSYGRYYRDLDEQQNVEFTATVNNVTYRSTTVDKPVTEFFDVRVEIVESTAGKRFVLHFTVNEDRAADVAYGQSLVISPRVVTIDTPTFGPDTDDTRYQEVLAFANTERPVFNPIVSGRYTTGSPTSLTERDQATGYPYVKSSNGQTITANDRTRRDTTSTWSSNMGVLKVTERLISATKGYQGDTDISLNSNVAWTEPGETFSPEGAADKHPKSGAYGGTLLNLRKPSITNVTKVAAYPGAPEAETIRVDAAGKYWYTTEVTNAPEQIVNPYEKIKTAGDVHNSRFVVTHHVTEFAEATGEVRLQIGGDIYDRAAFEALGYTVERATPAVSEVGERKRIQWLVTPPANERGTRGELQSGESFKLLYEVQLVDGYEDNVVSEDPVWKTDDLIVDSYVSLITDDTSLIPADADPAQRPEDFIVQSAASMGYRSYASDAGSSLDIDGNGDLDGRYAADEAQVEILKPRAEVRVNTTRPRIAYSNGMSGDNYFNSSDTIEYLVTHAKNSGSGLKEFVVENILPTHLSNDSTVSLSGHPVSTTTMYLTSGAWELPQATLDHLAADGTDIDDAFRSYVYVSHELAENGYEGGAWKLLNPGGSSILANERLTLDSGAERADVKKFRVVVKALQPERYLVPQGLRLDVDADPVADGKQSVLETDPTNQSIEQYPASVTDAAVKVGMRASSTAKSTLFVYGTAQAWGNYVSTSVSKLAQSQTRSYLTPSRPVVNVKYDALYYRSDSTRPQGERFGWSDIMAIAPKSSPHLKFTGEFINADDTMWSRDEDNTYSADTLVDPFVTFQLPTVMESGGAFKYVPADEITPDHPLSDEHRSRYSLTAQEKNLWTWKLVRADGSEASPDSHLKHTDLYAGPWPGFDRNVISIWFEGNVYPGDKIVVEFIGSVDAYSPGADAEDLKSRAVVTNSTGLLYPLNSQQNSGNRLGYSTDYSDFNKNSLMNDRLVFSERTLFQYETYDNFGKRKIAYSDLNRAGTVAPEMTPVREGGDFSFEVSVDNSKESGDRAYPYPILYDVLPFSGDTSISNATLQRGSQYSAWLQGDGMKLEREGAEKKTYQPNEYTVFVGPFTKQGGKIVDAAMVPHADAGSESFFDALGTPGVPSTVRDRHFVALDELKAEPELLKRAKTLLVLFNNPNEQLPGQSKLKFTYQMKAPLNAPAYLEQFDGADRKPSAALWNSFMATQRVSRFIPQESNMAGSFVTEKRDHVYLGNYVWHDVNYNGVQDEGDPFVDGNGRTLLEPSKDLDFDGEIDDPGINGVRVTLLTPKGYNVDALGNPIHRVGAQWEVVDEATGKSVLDEVFQQPIRSEGPLTTLTETDYHGNDGYYTFSNIQPGDYRVMLEFPQEYDSFSATTTEVFKRAGVTVYAPGEQLDVPAEVDDAALVTITDAARVDTATSDEERMSFDFGVAQTLRVGGTVFAEDIDTLDGYQAGPGEPGIAGYHVYLKRMNGDTAVDAYGEPMVAVTDAQGKYAFDVLPVDREYYIEVTDRNDGFNPEWVVSPFVHHIDPFAEATDNDGLNEKGTKVVKTNTLRFDLEGLFESGFADRESVSIGFYEKSTSGVIGNRVWDDLDRDGVQDDGEPGIAGQALALQQYVRPAGGEWTRTGFTQSTVSNADGYYYFTKVPSAVFEAGEPVETRYQVVVDRLVDGYTFALAHQGSGADAAEFDSDFFPNGTMHRTAKVGDNLVSIGDFDEATGVMYGINDNTVDLGLVAHARSSLSGEVFIDTDGDGVKNDAAKAENRYTATLEVLHQGAWVEAKQDAQGLMIEPAVAQSTDPAIRSTAVSAYSFENLHIMDSVERVPYEYRVRVTEIPLWQDVTKLHVGSDPARDNDFVHDARTIANSAVSDARILGELQQGQLHPIETFTGVPAVNVDLGLAELETEATIGDRIWHDRDGDGVQDAGEPGLVGVEVVLNRVVAGALVPVDRTRTGADGAYEFTAEVADTDPTSPGYQTPHVYAVEFNLTSRQSLSPTVVDGAATESKFSNLEVAGAARYDHGVQDPRHTAVSEEIVLVEADANGYARYDTLESTELIDGGVLVHESVRVIGDTVYDDRDRDGVQSAGEPGIGGLTVKLFKLNRDTGLWEASQGAGDSSSTITDASGRYRFEVEVADLDKDSPHYREAEEYRVLVEAPANMRLVEIGNVFFYQSTVDVDGIAIAKPFSYVLTDPVSLVDAGADGVDLATARDVLTADAGFAVYDTSVVVGGRVWDDADLNGLQDAGEVGVAGRTAVLWELVDGEWQETEDLAGRSRVVTGADGIYAFEVSPTRYEEHEPGFLAPREYRVTVEREGYHVWSPLNVGDDPTIDSDVQAAEPEFGTRYTGVTHSFVIADHANGVIDIASVRDDRAMDIGLKVYDHEVIVGGAVWNDIDEDGRQQHSEPALPGQRVTLWERIDDEWRIVEDARGRSTQLTDDAGRYEFEVHPTSYDEESEAFLQPREYRTTVGVPQGYRLSGGSLTAELEDELVVSANAQISELDEDGKVDLAVSRDDLTLGFPFAAVPEPALALTGARSILVIGVLVLALGAVAVLIGVRRQRRARGSEEA
ncbi:SdrD B-like domain-containing protein [Leucobacter chironomi]|uniref:SdrD B-like domain-containing protein n=1 Tax=Leucobacter chironomi TaxID=491918 RepID=UPI0003FF03E6|nr:SdrD B-like domain-containing protein [Leucobacter chironomi]